VLHVAGDQKGAEESYRAAIALGADAEAWANLGVLYMGQDRTAEATEAFEQAVKRAPGVLDNHRNRGDVLDRIGLPSDAREAWARAVEIGHEQLRVNPADALTLVDMAACEARLGETSDARDHLARALDEQPGSSEIRYQAAVVYAALGELDAGVEALRRAVQLGASPGFARDDVDLAPLRNHRGFAAALASSNEGAPAESEPVEMRGRER